MIVSDSQPCSGMPTICDHACNSCHVSACPRLIWQ
jgi:hypothetical protein